MAKWFGKIGYEMTVETAPGIMEESCIERPYYGELIRNNRRLQSSSEKLNDDINISNEISIIADPFACHNFHSIRYATFMGNRWKVTNIDVQYPRLVLSLGGLYNG